MSDPCTAATALLSFKMADRLRKICKMTQQLQCSNDLCNNCQTDKFCQQCGTPLIKRYLWAVGGSEPVCGGGAVSRTGVAPSEDEGGIEAYKLGDLVDARYLLVGDLVNANYPLKVIEFFGYKTRSVTGNASRDLECD